MELDVDLSAEELNQVLDLLFVFHHVVVDHVFFPLEVGENSRVDRVVEVAFLDVAQVFLSLELVEIQHLDYVESVFLYFVQNGFLSFHSSLYYN